MHWAAVGRHAGTRRSPRSPSQAVDTSRRAQATLQAKPALPAQLEFSDASVRLGGESSSASDPGSPTLVGAASVGAASVRLDGVAGREWALGGRRDGSCACPGVHVLSLYLSARDQNAPRCLPRPPTVERLGGKASSGSLAAAGEHRWGAPFATQVALLFRRSLRTRRFQARPGCWAGLGRDGAL